MTVHDYVIVPILIDVMKKDLIYHNSSINLLRTDNTINSMQSFTYTHFPEVSNKN